MLVLLVTAALAGPPRAQLPEPTHEVYAPVDVAIAMPDGVRLWTRVIRPTDDAPRPTVLIRYPYDQGLGFVTRWCQILAGQGYACVAQLVRGRGRSEGAWVPFAAERADGLAAIAWVREQAWSDGTLALAGDSYLAATGWAVLGDRPEGVKTLVSRVFGPDTYAGLYEDGLFRHELATAWTTMMPGRVMRFAPGRYHRALEHRPRTTMDLVAAGYEVPWFRGWISAEDPADPYWSRPEVTGFDAAPAATDLPVLMIGGWADTFLGPTFTTWDRLATRDRSLLVVGPWEHLGRLGSDDRLANVAGGLGDDGTLGQWPRVLAWLDHHLRGGPPPEVAHGVVTYVVGGDRWEHAPTWPPATTPRVLGLAAGPDRCGGRVVDGPTTAPETLTFRYDPDDPLRSAGDAMMLAGSLPFFAGVRPGFRHLPPTLCDRRADVLRFVGEPLPTPVRLAGQVTATLRVSSTAPDTAVVLRLVERRADGHETLVREDIARLAPRGVPPGTVVEVALATLPLDYVLQAGSRVQLDVSSSSFPRFEAHPNVTGPLHAATTVVTADQTLHLAGSTVTLPVVTP